MKKIISLLLCLVLMTALAAPVSAAGPEIIFTADSGFTPGCTVTVDKGETLLSCYNNGTSDIYNAYLEGDVQYYWMRNDSYYADGLSITIREEDRGCQFYCMAALYADEEHTQQIGTIYSATFSVPNDLVEPEIPEITTEYLPHAVVGREYYFQLECTDPDVTYSLLRSSLPDGMYLTQHGEIEGTPTKAGFWYVVIMATPEAGEDYATTAEFEFYVDEGSDYTLEIMRLPSKLAYYSGEYLDMTGAWVRIWTPDGYKDSYDGDYLGYSDQPLVSIGDHLIRLTYMDGETTFVVTVLENPNAEYHTVTYYLDGELYEEMEVRDGDYAEDLMVPEVEGMSFKGWLTVDGEYYDFSAPVTGDVELYGVYGYVVALCFGIDDPVGWQVVEPGKCAIEPEPPAQEGKEFLGWYTEFVGGVKFDFSTPITGNINLYARFGDAGTPFTDVPTGAYYETPVLWALENGITTGATATTFNPGGTCLRAQVVTFLHRAEGNPAPTSTTNPFNDVKPTDYFYKPVLWAVEKKITNGTSATEFGARSVCSRAAVVTFLWRTAGSPAPKSAQNPFVDVPAGSYYQDAVLWAVENGITTGVDATHFGPSTPCSRAQVVTFLHRAYN